MNFIEELRWRGLIHDIMPGTEEMLSKGMTSGYIGFDPTADSLHVGSLLQIMLLVHFQRSGHKPYALVGGATGMVGDPTGKTKERSLLDEDTLRKNIEGIKKQLTKFLDFDCGKNSAVLVNNYDWFKDISFLHFIRDVGKHITVNYMAAKDSVKNRMESETGISFTEFSYQLLQGYDYLHLFRQYGCRLQMGGSDQWGNITTGTELIRKIDKGEAFAMTSPLVTKPDGSKFGKSEGGNVWLDPEKTSPYKFYQFWLNVGDDEAAKYIKIFTTKTKVEIESLIAQHQKAPHLRILQKAIAEEVTERVHSKEDLTMAQEASQILFGRGTSEALEKLSERDFLAVFEGIPQATIAKSKIEAGLSVIDLISTETNFLKSKGEAKRALQGNGISINKTKVSLEYMVESKDLIKGKYVVTQNGKNFFLVICE
ncbi:MAG: tyrosine--tRNA ligase [Flammeovirgaceae bacterium]